MGLLYINFKDVQARLVGKVRFQDPTQPLDENRMQLALANRLIEEAEGQVEQDLSPRYQAPFVSESKNTYLGLPDRPTKNIIRTLCELQACIRILETDFGAGTAVDAKKYIDNLEKRYRKIIDDNILAKFSPEYAATRQWKFPPLPDLQRQPFNSQADDGYAGMVTVTDRGEGAYPVQQMDDPSENWFNATFDENDTGNIPRT